MIINTTPGNPTMKATSNKSTTSPYWRRIGLELTETIASDYSARKHAEYQITSRSNDMNVLKYELFDVLFPYIYIQRVNLTLLSAWETFRWNTLCNITAILLRLSLFFYIYKKSREVFTLHSNHCRHFCCCPHNVSAVLFTDLYQVLIDLDSFLRTSNWILYLI